MHILNRTQTPSILTRFLFGIVWVITGLFLLPCPCWSGEPQKKGDERVIREALGAGMWFPKSKKSLEHMVGNYMKNADVPKVQGRIASAIAPHAGYIYSGQVAGYSFRAIKENASAGVKPETVVVLGQSHGRRFPGVALMDGHALETPLGEIALDQEAGKMLAAQSPLIFFDYAPHMGEHSAENEIPFLQWSLPGVSAVIGLMGDHDPQTLKDLVSALEALSNKKNILVIASSDMMHDPDYDLVAPTDRDTLKKMRRMDHEAVQRDWSPSKQNLCGVGPVLAAMRFAQAKGCTEGTVLHYRNCGDDFPETRGRWVVGYPSVVFAVPE